MPQAVIHDYFTWQALGTLTGASVAVIIVSNTMRVLFKRDSPWVGFLVSVLMSFIGAYYSSSLISGLDYVLAFLNACLLFCTATGMNQAAVETKPTPEGQPKPYGARKVNWLSPWLRRT
jgi:4-amino-4-deoxy-L-arabinose transferase-like glycosyltransferase